MLVESKHDHIMTFRSGVGVVRPKHTVNCHIGSRNILIGNPESEYSTGCMANVLLE